MEVNGNALDFSGMDRIATRFQELYNNHKENILNNNNLHQSNIAAEKEQYDSLQTALTSLSGISITKISLEKDHLHIECMIKKCNTCFVLDASKKLISIEVRSGQFQWINCQSIIAECQAYGSPNDLRHAVLLIGSVQESRALLQKHAAEFRKVCIVQYFAPSRVKFTYKNGMTVTIQASESYPQVPGCLQVIEINYFSISLDESFAEGLKTEANNKCFRQLSEMYYFFDQYKDV